MPSQVLERGASSPWSTPEDCINLLVECYAPGGGGGGSEYVIDEPPIPATGGGGGGGGGGYARRTIADPSGDYPFVIGAPGQGGSEANPGTDGGDVWFGSQDTNGTWAHGGDGGNYGDAAGAGNGGAGGQGAGGTTQHEGGDGAAGSSDVGGGGGGAAGYDDDGNDASGQTAGAASGVDFAGAGGDGGDEDEAGTTAPFQGAPDYALGGGAGGAGRASSESRAGGDGAEGCIVLTWEIAEPPPETRVTRLAVRSLSGVASAAVRLTRLVARTLSAVVDAIPQRVTRIVVRTLSPVPLPDPCEVPPVGEDLCGIAHPILWTEWTPEIGTTLAFAEVGLPDPAAYYHGWKPAQLLGVSDVRRSLAGHAWDYEIGRFSVRLADADRAIRARLATGDSRYWSGRELAVRLVSDAGRRTGATPRLMAWGLIDPDLLLGDDESVELPAKDIVGSMPGWGLSLQDLIPGRLIAAPEFPEARPEVREFGVPICYGLLSDEGSLADPPELTGNVDKPRGAVYDPPDWTMGWGDMPGPPAPTDLALEEDLDGGELSDDIPGDTYYVAVWSVGADGLEGDPLPFVPDDASAAIEITDGDPPDSGTTSAIIVSWTGEPTAAKYRVALGTKYAGTVRFHQRLETTGTTVTFTRNPPFGTPATPGNITPGATVIDITVPFRYYSVSAVLPSGETILHAPAAFGYAYCYVRRTRLEWEPVAGASAYRVYAHDYPTAPETRLWEVAAPTCFFDDDWLDTGVTRIAGLRETEGLVTPIYVGQVLIDAQPWHEFLVAGHAIADLRHWYYREGEGAIVVDPGSGTDYLVPFTAPWTARFLTPYRDVVGTDGVTRRRTVIYGRAAEDLSAPADKVVAGTATLRLNLDGIEGVGDGSGEVIDDVHLQAAHFVNHWLIRRYEDGNWLPPPMFPGTSVCQVHCPSFSALAALRRAELPPDGYVGAVVIGANGERRAAREWLTAWMASADMRLGPNRSWQIVARALDEPVDVESVPEIVDVSEIHRPTGDPQPRRAELANRIRYRYGPPLAADGNDWAGEATLTDKPSIAAYREAVDWTIELPCVRRRAVAAHVGARILRRAKTIPVYIEPEGDLCFERWDLGDVLRYTHARGLGSGGYVQRPFRVVGHTFLPAARRVRLECVDVTELVGGD